MLAIPEQTSTFAFNLQKVQETYDNYTVNLHAGLTMVMGHPFHDPDFCKHILKVQKAIEEVFITYHMEGYLDLYNVEYQVHATLIQLAGQHDEKKVDQEFLEEKELSISSKTQNLMNINYAVEWIKKTPPFDIELGPDVLPEDIRDQTLRITETGQIVMKGRPKDRHLLAEIRTEFAEKAGIIHKYGPTDEDFFFVIGYLKPHPRLNEKHFLMQLENCINTLRPHIQLALKVDRVKFIMYKNYSLDREACVWESDEHKLHQEVNLPENLNDTVIKIIKSQVSKFFGYTQRV